VTNVVNKNTDIDLGAAGVFRLPLASSSVSETDTIVRVSNGNIVAIGGLMKQSDSRNRGQVPGLGNLPIIGHAFKNTSRSGLKSELVILLKPTVIQSDDAWRQDVQDARDRVRAYRHNEYGRYWKEEYGGGNNDEPRDEPRKQ
jgi:MSHA biogenesis protein MshL